MSLTSGTDVSISASATGASALVLTTPGDASINSDDMAMTYTGALTVSADSVSMTATVGPVSVTSAGAVGLTSATTMDVSAGSILTEEAGTSYSLTVGTSSSMTVGGSGAFTFNEFSMAATGGAAGGIGLTSATTFDASSAGAMTLQGSSVLLKAGVTNIGEAKSNGMFVYQTTYASGGLTVGATTNSLVSEVYVSSLGSTGTVAATSVVELASYSITAAGGQVYIVPTVQSTGTSCQLLSHNVLKQGDVYKVFAYNHHPSTDCTYQDISFLITEV